MYARTVIEGVVQPGDSIRVLPPADATAAAQHLLLERIDAVTLDQANAAARKYFRTDGLSFVVLGNASKIRDNVKKYADQRVEVEIKDAGFGAGIKQ